MPTTRLSQRNNKPQDWLEQSVEGVLAFLDFSIRSLYIADKNIDGYHGFDT